MTVLEPCCKHKQFTKFLQELPKTGEASFTHYGDVTFPDWFTLLLLESVGSDAHFRFRTLDIATLNYILNRMRDHAFLPGKDLHRLQRVTIQARNLPDPLPQRAEEYVQEGRLIIQHTKRPPKCETITLKLPEPRNKVILYRMTGNFFAEAPNQPRIVTLKIV